MRITGLTAAQEREVEETLRSLVNFRPESCAFKRDRRSNPYYEKGDEAAPFISEAYLYNLLGKEDARSVLARVRRICEACGFDMETLYEDEGKVQHAE